MKPARTMTKADAQRDYGLSRDALEDLIAAGTVWTVTVPGHTRPRVVRDGLETWLRSGRPPAPARPAAEKVVIFPKIIRRRGRAHAA